MMRKRDQIPALGIMLLSAIASAGNGSGITAVELTEDVQEVVSMAFAPDDSDRLFVVERTGRIKILQLSNRSVLSEPFLEVTAVNPGIPRETGLLDLKFDPDFANNGFFYVSYTDATTLDARIARYSISADPNIADPGSEVVLKVVPIDQLAHVAGQLQFGPDGYLYSSAGDGSTAAAADPDNNAQNLAALNGKLLRLDLDSPPEYIPKTNPFVSDPTAAGEVWAYGLRNPWRFSFDRLTGDLYIADVGRALREEINFQPAASPGGENYGWNCMEAELCTDLVFAGCTCSDPSLTLPVLSIEHSRNPCDAVIGGYVYRGAAIPALLGRYFYADYCQNYIRSAVVVSDGERGWTTVDVQDHSDVLNPGGRARNGSRRSPRTPRESSTSACADFRVVRRASSRLRRRLIATRTPCPTTSTSIRAPATTATATSSPMSATSPRASQRM